MKTKFQVILAILLFLILCFYVTNFFVSQKVESLLEQEKNLSYSGFNVNVFLGNLTLKDLKLDDAGHRIKVKKIDMNIDILHYLFNSEIIIQKINAEGLDVKLMSSLNSKSEKRKTIDIKSIKKINIRDADITYKNEDKTVFELSKMNFKAKDLNWPLDENYEWITNETLEIDAKDLKFNMDTLHNLNSETFEFSNQLLSFKNFSIHPKFNKSEYINHIKTEKDLMNLKSNTLKISGFELFRKDSILQIKSKKIQIDSTQFNIYRDKTIADDISVKSLYSQALRELDFQLSIDSLLISEMDITYQELIQKDRKVGSITFNSIQAEILNIHNSLNEEESKISVEAHSRFSKGSEIIFNFNFVPDHEQFYVSTSLKRIEDESINNFFASAVRMEIDGTINKIKTSSTGNNFQMNGDFSIAYDKLKLNILKNDGSKNNFASLISNAIIKNRDVDESYQLESIKRDATKSFWNYVWTFHLQGLKKSLL